MVTAWLSQPTALGDDGIGERDDRRSRLDPRAVHADIDLDDDRQDLAGRLRGSAELDEMREAVDGDDRLGARRQIDQSPNLQRADDLVGDQDVADAAIGHRFGLAELCTRHADGTGGDLHSGDFCRLVTLHMRPPGHAVDAASLGNARDIRLEDVEIDEQRRRVQCELGTAEEIRRFAHAPPPGQAGASG